MAKRSKPSSLALLLVSSAVGMLFVITGASFPLPY